MSRPDVAAFEERLHRKDQDKLHGRYSRALSEIEARVEPNETIQAVLPGAIGNEDGVLAVTSAGVRWTGRASRDWMWDQLRSVASGRYAASIITTDNVRVDFLDDAKRASVKEFASVVEAVRRDRMPYT